MRILNLVIKEIFHRKINFLLSTIVVLTAVALLVSFFTMSEASNRETIRLTRDMGFNLRIIPKATDMNKFWTTGFSEYTMPEEYLLRFTSFKDFSFAHLTATLNKQVVWNNREVLLTGISAEIEPSGKKKTPMIFSIEPGTVYIGFELAKSLDLDKGSQINIFGKKFTVAQTLSETGSSDDIRIYAQLSDIQDLINLKGKINEIIALNCLCLTNEETDPLVILRSQLSEVLPDAKIVMNKTIAVARERQRRMLEEYFAYILPFVLLVSVVWIASLSMMNVKDRKREIGILRALGYDTGKLASLFMGKAMLSGIVGAILGFGVGTVLSLAYGPEIFKVTSNMVKPDYELLGLSFLIAPAFAALSSFIPTVIAITQDPAQTLREE